MCLFTPSIDTSAQQKVLSKQLRKGNAVLSNEKTASTTSEKKGNKRTMNSLRVPMKDTQPNTVGANTEDTATGLNIPI